MSSQPSNDRTRFVDARWAFERYEAVRARLPEAGEHGAAEQKPDLGALAGRFDAFVFDSFGVLNVGETAIDGAAGRIADLRARGKQVLVLTNAATAPLASLPQKYAGLGFDFTAGEIVSSRGVLAANLQSRDAGGPWLVVAPEVSNVSELGVPVLPMTGRHHVPEGAGGIILLSNQTMNDELTAKLGAMLADRPMPLLVGNPDLVAPREEGFSLEPGFYAHHLADHTGVEPEFFGKPFSNAFDAVRERLGRSIPASRIAMVGDTLHTDVLGGSAAGFGTVLVTNHGVLKTLDISACIKQSAIVPDYVVPQI